MLRMITPPTSSTMTRIKTTVVLSLSPIGGNVFKFVIIRVVGSWRADFVGEVGDGVVVMSLLLVAHSMGRVPGTRQLNLAAICNSHGGTNRQ